MRYWVFLAGTACAAALVSVALMDSGSARIQQQKPPQPPRPYTPAPQSPCLKSNGQLDIACTLEGPNEDPDVKRVKAQIQHTFQSSLAELNSNPPKDEYHKLVLLGRLELYDRNLSVNRNQPCIFCHMPETGFTTAVSIWNQTIVANPGSVPITNATGLMPNYRIAMNKPYPYSYAPFAPILHEDLSTNELYGGNFWEMHATGVRTTNPATEQAEAPPLNPLEMAMNGKACVVYRLSQAPYAGFFKHIWGAQSFQINWPGNIEEICNQPLSTDAPNPMPVNLTPVERGIVDSTYQHFAMAIATNEASPEVSPFTSKFDAYLAGKATLTPEEQRGFVLFNGKGRCNQCHLDGVATGNANVTLNGGNGALAIADKKPLFTDWGAHNIGVPRNLSIPWYYEDQPDQYGYVANPQGLSFIPLSVGAFLRGPKNPNPDWARLADRYDGRVQTPTLRNVDKRPYPGFVKAYMSNGYLKSLKAVVHFYNTSQALPRCPQGSPGEAVSCWPPPAVLDNLNTDDVGNLGLTGREEDDIVAFLRTLTDQSQLK